MPKNWTEADYAAAGTVQVKLRLPARVAALLRKLAEESGLSMSALVEVLVEKERDTN